MSWCVRILSSLIRFVCFKEPHIEDAFPVMNTRGQMLGIGHCTFCIKESVGEC